MEINRTQIPSTEPERQYYYIEQAKKYVKKPSQGGLSDKVEVELTTPPGIGGGVHLLLGGEAGGLPIAQALRLRDALAKNQGRHLTNRLLLDAPFTDNLLKIHEACFAEVP